MMVFTKGHIPSSLCIALLSWYCHRLIVNKTIVEQQKKYEFLSEESTFSNYLIRLIAMVIRVDGKKTDSEFRFIEKSLDEFYTPQQLNRIMSSIKLAYTQKSIPINIICKMIIKELNAASKVQLMYLLIGISTADGLLTKKERELLLKIAIGIRLPHRTFISLESMFHFVHEGAKKKKTSQRFSSKLQLEQAFKILEIETSATTKEIKKAYRKLALLHHPDRLVHLGAAHQLAAKQKFQRIAEAYDFIKEKRGFK